MNTWGRVRNVAVVKVVRDKVLVAAIIIVRPVLRPAMAMATRLRLVRRRVATEELPFV